MSKKNYQIRIHLNLFSPKYPTQFIFNGILRKNRRWAHLSETTEKVCISSTKNMSCNRKHNRINGISPEKALNKIRKRVKNNMQFDFFRHHGNFALC